MNDCGYHQCVPAFFLLIAPLIYMMRLFVTGYPENICFSLTQP